MTRAAILLRGTNVGGHHRLPMSGLRGLLTELGAPDLQSGQAFLTTVDALAPAGVRATAGSWRTLLVLVDRTA